MWGAVQGFVFYLCKWQKFLEMRWCGCGPSSKLLIRSLLGGTESLARYALSLEAVSGTNLSGITRATPAVKRFAIIAAFATSPAETLLDSMFEDDRLLIHGPAYRDRMDMEFLHLARTDKYVWERCSAIVGEDCTADNLLHLSLKASLISYGVIWHNVFKQFDKGVMKIAYNDVEASLEELFAVTEEATLEPALARIWRCFHLHGVDFTMIVRAIRLFQKTPFSTNLVEQGHGAGAVIMKVHERFGD